MQFNNYVEENRNGKILYLGGFELPDKNAAAHRVLNNGKVLREYGCLIDYIGITHDKNAPSFEFSKKSFFGFNCFSQHYPSSFFEWIKYSVSISVIKKYIRFSNEQVACIILYNYPAIASLQIIMYAKKKNIKILSDCTEWYSYRKTSLNGWVRFIDSELRMRVVNRVVDGLVAISQYLYDFYHERGVLTINVPPLVDISDTKWVSLKSYTNNTFTVVYAGSPGFQKDKLDVLVEAVNALCIPIVLRIVGIEKSDFKTDLESESKELSKIVFIGRVSHEEALNEVKKADYTCFFRENNRVSIAGFPTKFVESITAGTPVITNRTSDLEKYCVDNDACVFVDDISVGSIKKGLEDAYHHKRVVKDNTIFDYHNYLDEFKKLSGLFSGK